MKTFESSCRNLTDKEVIELGNMAFRVHQKDHPMGGELYHSKKWKLHLFENKKGKIEKIAIVDEQKPLKHIDELWPSYYDDKGFECTHRSYDWSWVEIDKYLVIEQYGKFDITKILIKQSQYSMFTWLEQHGFMGDYFEV